MQLFEPIYHQVIRFSRRKDAPYYLSLLSFVESFILPFPPPDVMLAPMSLAQPERAMRLAGLTLIFSVLGGLIGYLIGAFLFDLAQPLIVEWGYQDRFQTVMNWFGHWGFWAVLVAGFSPVPYKIFTIAAGVLNLAILPFVLASIIGRGARFFLVAGLIFFGGEPLERNLRRYVDIIGWVVVALIVVAVILLNI